MDDCRVVAPAEGIADLRQGVARQLAAQIHGDLARHGEVSRPLLAVQVIEAQLEVGGDDFLDEFHRYLARLFRRKDSVERFVDEGGCNGLLRDGRIGDDSCQCAFQLADVVVDAVGDGEHHVVRHVKMLKSGFLSEDRYARFEIGRLDVCDEAPFKARAQTVFERLNLSRMTVARQDDVLVRIVQRVERMEEFFLRMLFLREELDVVDEQDVDVAVFLPEGFGIAVSNGVDEFVREFFARNVEDAHLGEFLQNLVPDGVHEMRLAESHAAVHEEGIVDPAR